MFKYLILISRHFYFSFSFSVLVLIEKIYQTFKTVFTHIFKHLEVVLHIQLSSRYLIPRVPEVFLARFPVFPSARAIKNPWYPGQVFDKVVNRGLLCLTNHFKYIFTYRRQKAKKNGELKVQPADCSQIHYLVTWSVLESNLIFFFCCWFWVLSSTFPLLLLLHFRLANS